MLNLSEKIILAYRQVFPKRVTHVIVNMFQHFVSLQIFIKLMTFCITMLYVGKPDRVTNVTILFLPSGALLYWKAPFALTVPPQLKPAMKFCVTIVGRDMSFILNEFCNILIPAYLLPLHLSSRVSHAFIWTKNKAGPGIAARIDFPGEA